MFRHTHKATFILPYVSNKYSVICERFSVYFLTNTILLYQKAVFQNLCCHLP
jgi:hypothetical protein